MCRLVLKAVGLGARRSLGMLCLLSKSLRLISAIGMACWAQEPEMERSNEEVEGMNPR
jgi:hypothetical protein